ncbi:MAG: UDP-2,4-diacetamido-2,4,6-trideoxy-beta-L-altropyranose hydrolase [Burkholderiaceae bacterium]|nr:UDP-2,4-diacetamido-2,4,6-trideoxy-beta-L-altropyranose hydrolase [Burkholderiaceae bacterium]
MNVVIRADASLLMGTGHVMRCLTLADALTAQGADCQFICREHQGNLIEQIRHKGYRTHALPVVAEAGLSVRGTRHPAHAAWLGSSQEQDATDCALILAEAKPDWLIVDHYALDARWERALKPCYCQLMVIDDLADRPHACDVLLDQTFGRHAEDYRAWVPAGCQLLCGSQYALLRPEFAALRPYSLERRTKPQLRQLLITMGGVDKDNATGQVLEALRACPLPAECQIKVVMGSTAPWMTEVNKQALTMPWSTNVMVGVSDMARLMADSDLAIGAAGATSWERCCLGLPTIMVVQAQNQHKVAHGLELAGAVQVVNDPEEIPDRLPVLLNGLLSSPTLLAEMGGAASRIADGRGVATVIQHLEG